MAEIRAAYQREQAAQQAALATANDDAVPTPAPREDDPMLDANSDDDESAPALPAPPSPTRMSDEDEADGELEWSPPDYMPELADLPVAEAKKLKSSADRSLGLSGFKSVSGPPTSTHNYESVLRIGTTCETMQIGTTSDTVRIWTACERLRGADAVPKSCDLGVPLCRGAFTSLIRLVSISR